jgi:CBS domain-containing protein/sporulation protein YlmC with PRC-barrel domain
MVFFAEAYLSALLRYGVYDPEGRYVGRLDDVLANPHEKFPVVTRIAIKPKGDGKVFYVPWADIRSASQEGMRLAPGYASSTEFPEGEMQLRHEVMDRQIVDVSGQRVVRVHDLKLGAVGTHVLLTHADVGGRGMMRRLGWEHFTVGFLRMFHIHIGERLIAWEHVQSPTPGGELHVDHARDALKRMHPADLADIAEELSAPERAAFLGAMDEETAADAMQEMEPEALVATVGELSDEEASELIDEMDPDAGADLLADLPEERKEKLLSMMDSEEAADLRKLLSYPEDSAGGLMTTDQVSVPNGITVLKALDIVREEAQEVDPVYYVHVVDKDGRLLGMLSLRELIIAEPEAIVDDLMRREVATVQLHTHQEDIARLVARYNLLAVPVIDEDGRLHGIVTADDAIDAVIPTSFKKRIPKAFAR